jgi:hypothetical protein
MPILAPACDGLDPGEHFFDALAYALIQRAYPSLAASASSMLERRPDWLRAMCGAARAAFPLVVGAGRRRLDAPNGGSA